MYVDLLLNKTAPQERLDHASVAARCDEIAIAIFTATGAANYLTTTF